MTFDHAGRRKRLRELMSADRVEVAFLSVGADLPYFSGYEAMPSERLTMLVLPLEGEPVLVIPELEAPRATGLDVELRPWGETEDPAVVVASLAGRPGVALVGDHTWSVFLLALQDRLPFTRFLPAAPLTRELRMRKDREEVAALRHAAEAADRVLARLPREVRFAGRTEAEVARNVIDLTLEEGHDEARFWIVASGPNAASPHHTPGGRVIAPGDLVIVDFGGRYRGYHSDTTRTLVVREPTARQREVHAAVAAAQEEGRKAAGPGVTAESVDRAAREVIELAGYGDFFIHRAGHGIGLDGHEHPYLVEGNQLMLEPGMAFSVEPGIYLPGELGVRIEDICVVTDVGLEVLNDSERDLVTVE